MQIGIRELKAKLSEFVHRAQDGEHIEITDHGTPVAHIVPLPVYFSEEEGMILRDPTPLYDAVGSTKTGRKAKSTATHKETYASLLKEVKKLSGITDTKKVLTKALTVCVQHLREKHSGEKIREQPPLYYHDVDREIEVPDLTPESTSKTLLKETQKIWGYSSPEETLVQALEHHIRYKKQMSIVDYFGKIDFHPGYNPKDGRRKR